MLEAGVLGSRKYERGQPHLLDMAKPLHQGVVDDVHQHAPRYLDKTENRIVDDFPVAHLEFGLVEYLFHLELQFPRTGGGSLCKVLTLTGIDNTT